MKAFGTQPGVLVFTLVAVAHFCTASGSSDRLHGDAAADYSARHGGRAVLVMVDGKIVFERYDNGFGPDTATHLHRATKGFWGPVIAAMIEDGLIDSFDTPGDRYRDHTFRSLLLRGKPSETTARRAAAGLQRGNDEGGEEADDRQRFGLVFRRLDRNGDGQISRGVCGPELRRWFDRLDEDEDRSLDMAGLKPVLEQFGANRVNQSCNQRMGNKRCTAIQ